MRPRQRALPILAAAVLTVGAIEAGRDNNVIPDAATLRLNLRWFSEAVREQLLQRIDGVNPAVEQVMGQGRVVAQLPAVMGSEDFQEAFRPLKTPYAFLLIGVAPPKLFAAAQAKGQQFPYANHNPDFMVDLDAIPIGTQVNTAAALALLRKR